jgi:hypothetical protein
VSFIKHRFSVSVGGIDVTSNFLPLIQSFEYSHAAGKAASSASFDLADVDGSIAMPQDRAPIQASISGVEVFTGFVTGVAWSIDKKSGRNLKISASSADHGGKVKEPDLRNKDDSSFGDVFREWGQKAGLDATAIGDIASIERDYWIMQNESFMSWGQRMAREMGGTFRVIGNRAFIAPRNEGLSVSGRPLTQITAAAGVNLISAEIEPIVSRPKFKDAEISYFDKDKGERVSVKVPTGIDDVEAAVRTVISAAKKGHAEDRAKSHSKESNRRKGGGSVTILGDPAAEPEAVCKVSGCRPGVDGSYRIDDVKGQISKGGGYTVSLGLKMPSDGAGVDSR